VPQVIVQFKNAEDGALLGPAINLPSDTNREALQMLVNKLRGEVGFIYPECKDVHPFIDYLPLSIRMKTPYHTRSTSYRKSPNL
jgi:hypothetical protein